ncbi:MAG TPA: hypothetical protein VI612_02540 [Candidatus Nanoarchaeia archaeon]|nr:hypothetical protein [Candidatus Nanoarchaeia archaeon]
MAELIEKKILAELKSVKAKVAEMDKELHLLREDFSDTHLSEEERKMVAEALEEVRQGKTVPLEVVKKRLGL